VFAAHIAVFVAVCLLIFFLSFAILYGGSMGALYLAGTRSKFASGLAKVIFVPLCGLLAYVVSMAVINGPTRCGNAVEQTPFGSRVGDYYHDGRGNVTAVCLPHFAALPASIGREWARLTGPGQRQTRYQWAR
jgi:hypothetical protein